MDDILLIIAIIAFFALTIVTLWYLNELRIHIANLKNRLVMLEAELAIRRADNILLATECNKLKEKVKKDEGSEAESV